MRKIRVAAIQASSIMLNRSATVEKACELIQQAGREGAQLALLPEVFVPGYPVWLNALNPGERGTSASGPLYAEYLENSVTIGDEADMAFRDAARSVGIHVAVGVSERAGGSMYNSLFFYNDSGELLGRHQKLVPTRAERLLWMPGNGSTLGAFDTNVGKLGGLICWENYMPLARFALYNWGTQIYLAPTWADRQTWLSSMQHIAFEGSCYVVSCTCVMRVEDIPERFAWREKLAHDNGWLKSGNSAVVSPSGQYLAGPLWRQEGIVCAELDLDALSVDKGFLDVAGHYSRPDVFQLTVDRSLRPQVREIYDA